MGIFEKTLTGTRKPSIITTVKLFSLHLNLKWRGCSLAKNLESSFLLDFYGSMLGEKQRRLFASYYDDDLSLAEIADLEGMSRQGVRDAVKRAENQLYEMEERLGLARRFLEVQKGLGEIRECTEQLAAQCCADGADPQTLAILDRLLAIVDTLEKNETEA